MWGLLKETFKQWYEDNTAQHSAALAFYAIFAIAPLLIIAVAIAGAVITSVLLAIMHYLTPQVPRSGSLVLLMGP